MSYTRGSGAVITVGVDGASTSRRDIDSVGDSLRRLNDAKLQSISDQIGALHGSMGNIKSTIGEIVGLVAGGITAGAFADMIRESIDAADNLGDLSKTTGVAISDLAGLSLAANQSGGDLEGIADAVSKLSVNMGKNVERFKALGVTASEPLEAFKQLSDVVSAIEDPNLRAALAADALGKGWKSAAPLMAEGGQRIGEMVERGKELSGVTQAMVDKSDAFNDKMAEMGAAVAGVKMKIADDMIPALTEVATAITTALTESGKLEAVWVALGAMGAFAFTNEFASATVKVKDLTQELENLQHFKQNADTIPVLDYILWGSPAAWDAEIASKKKEIADVIAGVESARLAAAAKAEGDKAEKERNDKIAKEKADAAAKFLKLQEAADKAKQKAAQENAASVKTAQDYIATLELERSQIGLTTDQIKMMTAARMAEKAPTAEARKTIMEKALALDIESKAWAEVMAAAKAAAEMQKKFDDGAATVWEQVRALEAQIETYGLVESAVIELEKVKVSAKLASAELSQAETAALEMQLAGLTRLASKRRELEGMDAAKQSMADLAADARRMSDTIESSLTDALMRGFESGKGFGQNLIDTIKNMFSTLVLRPIVQGIISPASNSLAGFMQGGGMSGGSTIGGAINLISMGKTLYSGFSGAFASGMGTMITNLGTTFGSTAMASFGSGMAGVAQGLGPTVAGSASGIGSAGAYSSTAAAGSSAAAAIPIVGWVIAAMATANALYKKGWDSTNGTMSKFGTVFGSASLLLDKFNRALGMSNTGANLWSGQSTVARLFGRKNPEVESFGIEGAFGAGGFDGKAYQNILEKGGTFRSDKRYEMTAALDADTEASFDDTIKNLILSVQGFGAQMGIEADHISNYTKSIKLELTKDDAKNQELIAKLFGDIGNELATALVPSIAELGKADEAAADTLARLTSNYVSLDAILFSLGTTFGAVGMDSLKARERLVDLTGGIESLANGAASFAQNFMSEAERLAPIAKTVNEGLAALGLAGVDTREKFKDVVLGLDLTSEAGAETYAKLMSLQDGFAALYPFIDETAVALKNAAQEEELRTAALEAQAAQLQATRDSASDLLGGADAAFNVLQRVVGAEKDLRTAAHDTEMKAIQKRLDASNTSIAKSKTLADSLHGALDSMKSSAAVLNDRASAQGQIKAALAIARAGGPLPSSESLKGALATVSQDASSMFSTFEDYQRDFYRTARDIADLAGITDSTLSIEEKTLEALTAQQNLAQVVYEAEMKRLDGILESAQSELDVLKGMDTTLLTIAQALQGFASSLLAANSNPIVAATGAINGAYQTALGRAPEAAGMQYWQGAAAGGTSVSDIVSAITQSPEAIAQSLYKEVLGRPGDAAGIAYWTKQLSAGLSVSEAREAFMQSAEYKSRVPGFATGGDHPGGWRIVGENGPELEATGAARIFNARQTSAMFSGGEALVSEMRALRAEVIELRKANSAENVAAVKSLQATEGHLDGAVNGGKPILVEAVA